MTGAVDIRDKSAQIGTASELTAGEAGADGRLILEAASAPAEAPGLVDNGNDWGLMMNLPPASSSEPSTQDAPAGQSRDHCRPPPAACPDASSSSGGGVGGGVTAGGGWPASHGDVTNEGAKNENLGRVARRQQLLQQRRRRPELTSISRSVHGGVAEGKKGANQSGNLRVMKCLPSGQETPCGGVKNEPGEAGGSSSSSSNRSLAEAGGGVDEPSHVHSKGDEEAAGRQGQAGEPGEDGGVEVRRCRRVDDEHA